jgi:AraC-like DNA-binding protein
MDTFTFFRFAPSPALAPFIEVIWGVRGYASFTREAVLPNGVVELMINFGPVQKVHAYADRAVDEDFRRAWLAGMQDGPLVIGSPDGVDHMGVRFRPGGAHAFFDMSLESVTNQVIELDDLLGGTGASELRERTAPLVSDEARAREVERWLLERRYGVHPYFATIRRALDLLHQSTFTLAIGEVCERLGVSNRHMIRQFREVVGVTPKTMSRIARFQAVVAAVEGHSTVDWARTAYRYGYADQSHLVREFRRMAA